MTTSVIDSFFIGDIPCFKKVQVQLNHRKQELLDKLNGILVKILYRRYMHEATMFVQMYPPLAYLF